MCDRSRRSATVTLKADASARRIAHDVLSKILLNSRCHLVQFFLIVAPGVGRKLKSLSFGVVDSFRRQVFWCVRLSPRSIFVPRQYPRNTRHANKAVFSDGSENPYLQSYGGTRAKRREPGTLKRNLSASLGPAADKIPRSRNHCSSRKIGSCFECCLPVSRQQSPASLYS